MDARVENECLGEGTIDECNLRKNNSFEFLFSSSSRFGKSYQYSIFRYVSNRIENVFFVLTN